MPEILQEAELCSIPIEVIGKTGGQTLTVNGSDTISISELSYLHESWLPDYMDN